MKQIIAFSALLAASVLIAGCGAVSSISNTVQNTALGKVNDKATQTTSNVMDTLLGNGQNGASPRDSSASSSASVSANASAANATTVSASSTPSIAAYQNYDFLPGETIIFDDNFATDQDGEFPSHWNLENGQGVVNTVNGGPAFLLTDGNMVLVSPRMKTNSYLTDPFTVEFDYLANGGYSDPAIVFQDADNSSHYLQFGHRLSTTSFTNDLSGSDVGSDEDYNGNWHHAAIIYKNGQLKAYLDNTRALVVPHCGFVPVSFKMGGVAIADHPITLKNIRIASGGSSNTIGNLLTAGKFVTHGITFDVGKASLRPESMGTLNEVAKYLNANAGSNFEIDGYTDNSGSASSNMSLSQQRADAVKAQLVSMGVDGSRLTTKGDGASNPIASNDTPEGKANNRRVEFIKM